MAGVGSRRRQDVLLAGGDINQLAGGDLSKLLGMMEEQRTGKQLDLLDDTEGEPSPDYRN
jgi:hypothetical protein